MRSVWPSVLLLVLYAARLEAQTARVDAGSGRHTTYACADEGIDGLKSLFARTLQANRKQFAGLSGPVRGGGSPLAGDKNTVEADQETSAVLALTQAFAITGDRDWLRKDVNGQPLIERAERALQFLRQRRFDPRLGLMTSGFAADWGDVSPIYADQRAIYLDDATPRVVGLYTNVLFHAAARELAGAHAALGDVTRAARWRAEASQITRRINAVLWQEARGFYRMHAPVAARSPGRDDAHIFAMGGNALAVLYGVAAERQTARIFETATARRKRHGVSTIAGVLLPPFPRGFFKHPVMAEEWGYQNGGQWDWFAGRLLLAAFERGHARLAQAELKAVAAKARQNDGLFEWHTRRGEGKGSATYAGSAGALGGAVFQGLFGVSVDAERLALRVRLAETPGEIDLYEPASGLHVAYRYTYSPASASISLDYQSNHSHRGRVSILLPSGRRPKELTLDGKPVRFEVEVVGADVYVGLLTDWRPHRLHLRMAARPPRDGGSTPATEGAMRRTLAAKHRRIP